jgi:hypothetical protein
MAKTDLIIRHRSDTLCLTACHIRLFGSAAWREDMPKTLATPLARFLPSPLYAACWPLPGCVNGNPNNL